MNACACSAVDALFNPPTATARARRCWHNAKSEMTCRRLLLPKASPTSGRALQRVLTGHLNDCGFRIADCLPARSLGAGGRIEKEPQHERSRKLTRLESSIRLYPRSRCLMIFNLAAPFRCRGYNMRFQGSRLQRTSLAHLSAVCGSRAS